MKCAKCNADIEQDAQFCPYCGNAVNHGRQCVKCGEHLDDDSDFCPYCGTKQSNTITDLESEKIKEAPQIQEAKSSQIIEAEEPSIQETHTQNVDNDLVDTIPYENNNGSKKWIFIIAAILILGILGGGGYYLMSNKSESPSIVQKTDSIAEVEDSVMAINEKATTLDTSAETDNANNIEKKKEFIKEMYEDFFENMNFNTENLANLEKYLSSNVAERILIQCPYDGGENDKSYIIDCFRDGALTYERPDYGDKVVKREINNIDDDWFEVTNYWDVVKEPVKVRIKIGTDNNGNLKVIDFR